MSQPTLTVLAGPTAVGKGTVCQYIRENYPNVWFSVSATTRDPRPGEVDGTHYYFVSMEEFDQMIADGQMLEYAVVHGKNKYGTPRAKVQEALDAGRPVILEIDLQGARQIRETMPDARLISWLLRAGMSWCRVWWVEVPRVSRSKLVALKPRRLSWLLRRNLTSRSSTTLLSVRRRRLLS